MCEASCCCEGDQGHAGHGAGACCCGPRLHRRFLSKQERIARLDAYREDLAAEMAEVGKRLAELQAGG